MVTIACNYLFCLIGLESSLFMFDPWILLIDGMFLKKIQELMGYVPYISFGVGLCPRTVGYWED